MISNRFLYSGCKNLHRVKQEPKKAKSPERSKKAKSPERVPGPGSRVCGSRTLCHRRRTSTGLSLTRSWRKQKSGKGKKAESDTVISHL